jgi:hypothetical protein
LSDPESLSRGVGPVCAGKASETETVTGFYGDDFIDDVPLKDALVMRRTKDGRPQTNVPHLVVYHSPNGFEFGYGGSGPADLALNVVEAVLLEIGFQGPRAALRECSCFSLALELHQEFKWRFIAGAPREGDRHPFSVVRDWVASRISTSKVEP